MATKSYAPGNHDSQDVNEMTHSEGPSDYNPFADQAAKIDGSERPFAPLHAVAIAEEEAAPDVEDFDMDAQPFGMPQPVNADEQLVTRDGSEDLEEEVSATEAPEIEVNEQAKPEDDTIAQMSMAELVDRFAVSLKNRAARIAQPVAEPAATLPAALQPIVFDDDDFGDEVEDEGLAAFALGEDTLDDDVLDEGYSSLLSMKSTIGQKRSFAQVADQAPKQTGEHTEAGEASAEPVLVFPAKEQRRVAPAAEGPARSPADRPYGSVAPIPQAASHGAAQRQAGSEAEFASDPQQDAAPQTETAHEMALRDALEKLQRLSNAG